MIITNLAIEGSVEQGFGYCTVCGEHQLFHSYEPIDFPCKRNGFGCGNCGAVARNRHVAHTIINEFRGRVDCSSLSEFSAKFDGNVWIGCVKEAVSRGLGSNPNVTRSEYLDGVPAGEWRDGVLCQDIQATTFADAQFDLVISEDVLEHVPNPAQAFQEIGRILRPGGRHIFTIPIDWGCTHSYARAIVVNGVTHHIHPPEIHGDPFRPGGVLAYYTYGLDALEKYCSLTGPTRMLSAHGDRLLEKAFQIHNSWVFVSEKA